jgi:pimeloyl-ACP methyl ester carboxylesterase
LTHKTAYLKIHPQKSETIMNSFIGAIKGVEYSEEMIAVDEAVRLKVMVFRQTLSKGRSPMVFVPGWVSSLSGWVPLIKPMARERDVYYIETREKRSALINNNARLTDDAFSILQNARDIITICDYFGINSSQTLASGSSLGATSLLEAMKKGKLRCGGAFLVGPNSEFHAPKSISWILSLPASFYHPIKYFLLWYLRTFRVDAKKEPEQMKRYDETLRMVEPKRLKHTARSVIWGRYTVWKDLETIQVPVAIAYAATDKLHSLANIQKMAKQLPFGRLHPCPTNLYMHSAKLLVDINAFDREIRQ